MAGAQERLAALARGIFEAERQRVAGIIAGSGSKAIALAISMGAYRETDRVLTSVTNPQCACNLGCCACCRSGNVEVTAAEALALAGYVKDTLDDAARPGVLRRISDVATLARQKTIDERHALQVACPFLSGTSGLCFAYPARPMRCRGHYSLNVEDCEAALIDDDHPIPLDGGPSIACAAASQAQQVALSEGGLDSRVFQLANAVEVALTEPDADLRWTRGERLFDAALLPERDEDAKTMATDFLKMATAMSAQGRAADRNARKRERRARRRGRR